MPKITPFSNQINSSLNIIYVVLDNVRSAQNVGAFFRTCDSLNVEKIFLCGITAIPPNKEIFKTALGATDSVNWEYYENTNQCIAQLKKEDCKIISVEQTDKSTLLHHFEFDFETPICLVFGNEIEGVSPEVINLSDECVEIPQFGTKHSLNVSVAGGIVIWDVVNKMLQNKNG